MADNSINEEAVKGWAAASRLLPGAGQTGDVKGLVDRIMQCKGKVWTALKGALGTSSRDEAAALVQTDPEAKRVAESILGQEEVPEAPAGETGTRKSRKTGMTF
jgi:hypothetical protein